MSGELEALGAAAQGGSAVVGVPIAILMYKMLGALQAIADATKKAAERAEKHYETEEELHRFMRRQSEEHQAAIRAAAASDKQMRRLEGMLTELVGDSRAGLDS